MTFTEKEQTKFLELIKTIDLKELAIPDEANRNWFKFGAYDALRILTERILTDGKPKSTDATGTNAGRIHTPN